MTTVLLQILDSAYENIGTYFDTVADFINNALVGNGSVVVHCISGISRSSTLVIGEWLWIEIPNHTLNDHHHPGSLPDETSRDGLAQCIRSRTLEALVHSTQHWLLQAARRQVWLINLLKFYKLKLISLQTMSTSSMAATRWRWCDAIWRAPRCRTSSSRKSPATSTSTCASNAAILTKRTPPTDCSLNQEYSLNTPTYHVCQFSN